HSITPPISLLLFSLLIPPPPRSTLFPYTTLFRSHPDVDNNDATTGLADVGNNFIGSNDGAATFVAGTPNAQGSFVGTTAAPLDPDRKSTRLNSSHLGISYAVFCLKKKKKNTHNKT